MEAGVSTATVSKALTGGKMGMSQETREKILGIARRLNYHPNLIEQLLF
jgi:DNA-binding LacI/PurR family transcriptional regulator